MPKKPKFDYHEHDELPRPLSNISNVASSSETTGAMPTPPQNADEMNAYQDLASTEIPKIAPGKHDHAAQRKVNPFTEHEPRPRV